MELPAGRYAIVAFDRAVLAVRQMRAAVEVQAQAGDWVAYLVGLHVQGVCSREGLDMH